MELLEGYVYHIKDEYFNKVKDPNLMKNKENGNYRPTYYCMKDENNDLLWIVPMSTKIEKYQPIYDKQMARYGKCLTIVIGKYDGKEAAFLLQNMFPITAKYLDHIHTKNGNPVPVHTVIQEIINNNLKQLKQRIKLNIKVVFPDVKNIEKIMLLELNQEAIKEVAATLDEDIHIDIENEEELEI